jgi:hypothetical protein
MFQTKFLDLIEVNVYYKSVIEAGFSETLVIVIGTAVRT